MNICVHCRFVMLSVRQLDCNFPFVDRLLLLLVLKIQDIMWSPLLFAQFVGMIYSGCKEDTIEATWVSNFLCWRL